MDTSERIDTVQSILANIKHTDTDDHLDTLCKKIVAIGDYNKAHVMFYLIRKRANA